MQDQIADEGIDFNPPQIQEALNGSLGSGGSADDLMDIVENMEQAPQVIEENLKEEHTLPPHKQEQEDMEEEAKEGENLPPATTLHTGVSEQIVAP